MSRVQLKAVWQFELEADDAVLVLKALGGRLKGDEVQRAKELGDSFTRQRKQSVGLLFDQMGMHESKITP